MQFWIAFHCLLVIVCAHSRDDDEKDCAMRCSGEEYHCIGGSCYCAAGYVLNLIQTSCVKCPGPGDKCYGKCCKGNEDGASLQCFQGTCQYCYDPYGNWVCRDTMDQYMMVTISQVAMGCALVLGIVAILLLITKICSADNLRLRNGTSSADSRLSIGSLQLHVEERLRDPPPRYARTPPPGASVSPALFFVNAGFVHDSSIPPPIYTAQSTIKIESNCIQQTNPSVHM